MYMKKPLLNAAHFSFAEGVDVALALANIRRLIYVSDNINFLRDASLTVVSLLLTPSDARCCDPTI